MADNHPFLGDFKPMDRDDFIQHFGVKGMKWGKRKNESSVEKSSASKAPDRKAEVKSMSDTELRSKINRLQMEKQYLDLTAPSTSKGKNEVKKILLNTAKQELSKAASQQATKMIKDALKSR